MPLLSSGFKLTHLLFLFKGCNLKLHEMRKFSLAQREMRSQVLLDYGSLGVLLDGFQNLVVHGDLVSLPLLRSSVGFLLVVEDVSVLLGLLSLDPLEVLVIHVVGDLHAGHIHAGGGGQKVPLVNATERASVDLVWSGDEKKSCGELLEDDDTLALVDSSEDDGDSSGCEGGTQLPGVLREEVLGGASGGGVLGGVAIGQPLRAEHPGSSILVSSDLLLDELRLLVGGLLHDTPM